MFTLKSLIRAAGSLDRAQAVLVDHYASKQQALYHKDRRYATLEFLLKYASHFHSMP